MISARWFFLSVCAVIATLAVAHAALVSDFTGTYSLGAPTPAGHDVQITISLSVTNNTSADISNATIALHDPRAARVTYGSLNGLVLPAGAVTDVNGSFRVPRSLYDSWQKGSSPAMSVSFSDANGNPARIFIEF